MKSPIRILIIEDEPLIAEDIAEYLIEYGHKVSGIAYDCHDAFKELKYNTPDFVLLDIELNCRKDGVEIAKMINQKYQLPFIYLSSFADRKTLSRVRETQPLGYIVKPFTGRDLFTTLEVAIYNFRQKQTLQTSRPKFDIKHLNQKLYTPLTSREFEILNLIYQGKTNRQIAEQLYVSGNTIKTHISNLYLKLDASSRSTALVKVRELLAS